jgi:hypothetical protein
VPESDRATTTDRGATVETTDAKKRREEAAFALVTDTEPTRPGWYGYSGGAQTMIFHLRAPGQWSVHLDTGQSADCKWGYIEQALSVWDLVALVPVTQ